MLIMGTGAPGAAYIQAYQFVSAGCVILPPFAVAVLQGLEDGVSMSGGLKAAGKTHPDEARPRTGLDSDGSGSSGFGTPSSSGTPQLPVSSRDVGSSVLDVMGLGVAVEGKHMHLLKVRHGTAIVHASCNNMTTRLWGLILPEDYQSCGQTNSWKAVHNLFRGMTCKSFMPRSCDEATLQIYTFGGYRVIHIMCHTEQIVSTRHICTTVFNLE